MAEESHQALSDLRSQLEDYKEKSRKEISDAQKQAKDRGAEVEKMQHSVGRLQDEVCGKDHLKNTCVFTHFLFSRGKGRRLDLKENVCQDSSFPKAVFRTRNAPPSQKFKYQEISEGLDERPDPPLCSRFAQLYQRPVRSRKLGIRNEKLPSPPVKTLRGLRRWGASARFRTFSEVWPEQPQISPLLFRTLGELAALSGFPF